MVAFPRTLAATVLLLTLALAILLAIQAYANGEEKEEEEEANEMAEGLGSIAAWGGVLFTGGFVVFREGFVRMARAGFKLPPRIYRAAIDIHAITSTIFGAAGLLHGYLLQGYATPLEYALASLVTFTLITGIILRFSRSSTARYARLLHAQRLLALAILMLLLAHIARVGE